MINGVTHLVITKFDVLNGIDPIKVATGYELNGRVSELPPASAELMEHVEPIYVEKPGFTLSLKEKNYGELHDNAKKYIEFIEENLQLSVNYISIGPEREKLLIK